VTGFEIDRTKNKENLRKHQLALSIGNFVFDGLYFETVDVRRDYYETRLIVVGPVQQLGDKLLSVAYTWRDQQRRIFSVRSASVPESREYHRRHARDDGRGASRRA